VDCGAEHTRVPAGPDAAQRVAADLR
jgi:hypothetical protein